MLRIQGYRIGEELGRGGMATVYRATQESINRQVALKVMSPLLLVDETFSERFLREGKISANLNHSHIVRVHDVGVDQDRHFIAMEHLDGGDLASRMQGQALHPRVAIQIVTQIADALDYAHRKGFVHRDIKPENILFREGGDAVLTDFGIARAVDSATQMTKTGAVLGTPEYMSPEQARGKEVDGRSDLYGLGVVFYELLTGKPAYEAADSVSLGIMHVTEPVPVLPPHLDQLQPVLDRIMAKDPDERYQHGGEVIDDLSPFVGGHKKSTAPKAARRPPLMSPFTDIETYHEPVEVVEPDDGQLIADAEAEEKSEPSPQPVAYPPMGQARRATRRVFVMLGLLGICLAIWQFERLRVALEPVIIDIRPRAEAFVLQLFDRSQPAGTAPDHHTVSEVDRSLDQRRGLTINQAGNAGTPQIAVRLRDRILERAVHAMDEGRLTEPSGNNAVELFQEVLSQDPGNQTAVIGLRAVAERLVDLVEADLDAHRLEDAARGIQEVEALDPNTIGLKAVTKRLDDERSSGGRLPPPQPSDAYQRAQDAYDSGQLVEPVGGSAVHYTMIAHRLAPDDVKVQLGVRRLAARLIREGRDASARGDHHRAEQLFEGVKRLDASVSLPENLKLGSAVLGDSEDDQELAFSIEGQPLETPAVDRD